MAGGTPVSARDGDRADGDCSIADGTGSPRGTEAAGGAGGSASAASADPASGRSGAPPGRRSESDGSAASA